LQGFDTLFCIVHSSFCIRRIRLPNRILLSRQPTRLAQAWPTPYLRAQGDAGIPLFVGQ
jgi:hypothetical protein